MKRKSKRFKRIRNLVIVCALWASFLTVSTYAWFIGMKTVNVARFEVRIATTEGLFLSMNGEDWTYSLDAKGSEAYAGNTNSWADEGLIPMSTIGDMDSTASRMILFEKGSLTTTSGGYRLLASRVDNYSDNGEGGLKQGKGYVVFDLFVKNVSGEKYYTENNELNEEAIFLTTNSKVSVSETGGEAGTGIENSVRVAFTQIGRVVGTTGSDQLADITGITCTSSNESGHAQVTGICRNAQIWEPNDTKHVQNAINWYTTSCRARTGEATYGNDCTSVAQTTTDEDATVTYAVSRVIDVDDKIDIYDGTRYNSYAANTDTYANYLTATQGKEGSALDTAKAGFKLVEFPYFTDTDKMKAGTERPTFMTLAPNSITKLRVYVYIEGQDVDNYDFASLGKQISVNFGFTKERFKPEDIEYNGPERVTPYED